MSEDNKLIEIGRRFDEARRVYDAMVAAIPAETSPAVEHDAILAASAPVVRLAEAITSMKATTPEGEAVRAKASTFIAGHN